MTDHECRKEIVPVFPGSMRPAMHVHNQRNLCRSGSCLRHVQESLDRQSAALPTNQGGRTVHVHLEVFLQRHFSNSEWRSIPVEVPLPIIKIGQFVSPSRVARTRRLLPIEDRTGTIDRQATARFNRTATNWPFRRPVYSYFNTRVVFGACPSRSAPRAATEPF